MKLSKRIIFTKAEPGAASRCFTTIIFRKSPVPDNQLIKRHKIDKIRLYPRSVADSGAAVSGNVGGGNSCFVKLDVLGSVAPDLGYVLDIYDSVLVDVAVGYRVEIICFVINVGLVRVEVPA